MKAIRLKSKRHKSVLRRHPWIFSGAIAECDCAPASGETVDVLSASGEWLAAGAFSPKSQIAVRIWTWQRETAVDAKFLTNVLDQAIRSREHYPGLDDTTAVRLVNSESDGLPGVIVDRYANTLVCQFLSAGAEFWKPEIVASLRELVPCATVFERSDTHARRKEGLPSAVGVLAGDAPAEKIEITEGPCRFEVDVRTGHKTGFYLDQRPNRRRLVNCVAGADVLNCFAYTGAFGVWALQGGAKSLVNIDTSAPALEQAKRHLLLNAQTNAKAEHIVGDVFHELRRFRDGRTTFDAIILDPPKFAASRDHVINASRGYKDINRLAMLLLRPGGMLFTFSCSGHMTPELFQKIIADAAIDAGRDVQILDRLGSAADHPVRATFPEGHYLKGLMLRVI